MDEFQAIEKFFRKPTTDPRILLGIGDDAAIIRPTPGDDLVVTTDTLVNNVHFRMDWSPEIIARRVLNVNVSDVVAMGAVPCWAILAITMPDMDEEWLSRFANSFHRLLQSYNMQLIGGDTTKGPLSVTLTVHGVVERGRAVCRNGARNNDYIYVSGSLGAAALAVKMLEEKTEFSDKQEKILLNTLFDPQPRVDLIPLLQQFASAAIDISDGLAADLGHICQQSNCRALVRLSDIPVHPLVKEKMGYGAGEFAITGGDDYEICFTVPEHLNTGFASYCLEHSIDVTHIGCIESGAEVCFLDENNKEVEIKTKGYQHF